MRRLMRQHIAYLSIIACLMLCLGATALGQVATQITNVPTTITHQGRLFDSGSPPTGTYDMQFKLYDTATVGTGMLEGSPTTITNSAVNVTNGIFTVQLDFGASAFPGADRFLEISVRHPGDPAYTTLAPRTQLTSAPYAIRSLSAASADSATTATTATSNVLKSGDTMSGVLNMGSNKITSLATPTNGTDAANKSYVDAAVTTTANYVFAYDTGNQLTPIPAGTYGSITFNTNAQINGWTHSGGASFTCQQTGLYLIEYAAQVTATANQIVSFTAWVNGFEVAGSELGVEPPGGFIPTPVSKSFIASINALDSLTLEWAGSSTTSAILQPGGVGSTRPSVSITIIRIK